MPSSSGRVVVLVQPNDDIRHMYAEFLEHYGFEVFACTNGNDALAAAPDADVVITGIRLNGEFDGVELLVRLRHDHRTSRMPVIVLTACVTLPDRMRAEDAGCDRFLPVPCLPDTLLREVRQVLLPAPARHALKAEAGDHSHTRRQDR